MYQEEFPDCPVSSFFFHLGQSVYRKIQAKGLQQQYNNPANRTVKILTHMLLALSYIPILQPHLMKMLSVRMKNKTN